MNSPNSQEDQPPPRAALYAALAQAQGQFTDIAKNRSVSIQPKEGRAYHFRYADLEAIIKATRPALSANGLALLQPIDTRPDGSSTMTTMLVHSSGEVLTSEVQIPRMGERDPKQYGALITYLRRYMATSILGVAADDDLDENGNHSDLHSGAADGQAHGAKAPAPAPRVARKPAADVTDATVKEAPPPPQPEQGPRDPAPAAGDGQAFVGLGELAFLRNKSKAVGKDLAELLTEAGGLVLEKLTRADFDKLKATLRALEG
jgi:hypothetical protein